MQRISSLLTPAQKAKGSFHLPLSLFLKKTFLLSLPFIIIVGIAIISYYRAQVAVVENHALSLNEFALEDLHLSLQRLLRNVKGDAHLLANHPLIPEALSNPTGKEAIQLSEQWKVFATQKRLYDQIRLLDLHGQELIRINLTPGGAVLVGQEQLQAKAHRYYFREAITLEPGQIYLSPLDLNVENNQIELPIKPMLRIGIPVTDGKGQKAGLVMLNYLAANVLSDITAHSHLVDSQTLLLNEKGYYLRGFAKKDEWAFMYPHTPTVNGQFSAKYPGIWQQLERKPHDQLISKEGFFSYQWISTGKGDTLPSPFDRHFVLISMISAERMAALKAPYRNAAWAAVLLSLPTIFIIAAIATRFRLRELNAFERLSETESNQRLILETVGEGILGLDAQGKLTFVNTRAAELTGFQPQEMMGNALHTLIRESHHNNGDPASEECNILSNLLTGNTCHTDSYVFHRKNGESFPVEYISSPIIKDGEVRGGVVSFFDITARKEAEKQIEHLVLYDALTDLPNKKLLVDRLSQQIVTARHTEQNSSLLYIDLDRFKQVNDALGHDLGDNVLIEVAKRLSAIAQEGDTVARIGSDEFVLLRANGVNEAGQAAQDALLIADEIQQHMQQPFLLNGEQMRLTASIGITIFPGKDGDKPDTILSQADTAASHAKAAGRNTTRFFTTEMEHDTKDWLSIHNRLLEALSKDAFTLVYQPKVQHDGHLVGLEALLRWNDEELGTVSPARFVPIAEQSGLIVQLTDFVLTGVCRQIREWIDAGFGDTFGHVAVNISSAHFSRKDFIYYIIGHIERSGIPAHALELEITERTLVDQIGDAANKVSTLRKLGVRFSIDDFGTGYSSLAYLQQLQLDRLKIDRAFVTEVYKDPDRQTIVEAIILLAKGLGIEVIAEGVENDEELQYLLQAGCYEFQGYHFFRPLMVRDINELLKQRTTPT